MRYRIEQESPSSTAVVIDTAGKQLPRAATAAEVEMWNLLIEVRQTLANEGGSTEAMERRNRVFSALSRVEQRAENVIRAKDCL
jgi:hypothetical protein